MERRPLVAPVLLMLLLVACDGARVQDSTLLQRDHDAKPEAPDRQRVAVSAVPLPEPATPAAVFAYVNERARSLAQTVYGPERTPVSSALTSLSYEQFRSIAFRPEAALWQDEARFAVQLVHPGSFYGETVRIHVVRDERIETLPFDKSLFRYEPGAAAVADEVRPDLGHAGFRIYFPFEDEGRKEVVVFLGASYFRLLGSDHVHGLSSRGLAVDIALESGEEFPAFREFWLLQPAPDAPTLSFFGLLDGPSVTGAYRFDLEPGTGTALDVDARLYARQDVAKLGVAPLSSMFLFGRNQQRFDDFRPQVHDSDGLLMHTSAGEWIWRPLDNGPGLRVTSLRDENPQGFGLLQRDRDFESYLDLEASYHRRPSEWVAMREGDWGSGGVELLVIPTESEFNDNVAAYWVPDQPFKAGDTRRYRYRLLAFDSQLDAHTLAQVERTRVGWDALPGQSNPPPRSHRRFVVDFSTSGSRDDSGPVEAKLHTSVGEASDPIVQALPDDRGWRAAFRLAPASSRPVDMRLYLEEGGRRLSETWSYVWYPDRVQ